MKKALVILMALALVASVFADDPTLEPAFKDFKGSASLGYKADINKEEFGMTNSASAEITFSFAGEAKKATEGSGIWGEIEIKTAAEKCLDKTEVSVEKAKIHFGDVFAINVKDHDVALGANGPDFISGDFSAKTAGVKPVQIDKVENGATVYKTETVTVDHDFEIPATATDPAQPFVGKVDVVKTLTEAEKADVFTNGFTAELALDKIANINVVVADNGVVTSDAKEIAVKADFDLKAVDNLTLWGGVSYNADTDDGLAYAAKLGYAIDKLSVNAAFQMAGDAKELGAGVVYTFGDDYEDEHFDFIKGNKKDDKDKLYHSSAVAAVKTTDFSTWGLGIGAFDNASFVKGLVAGAELIVADVSNFATGTDFAALNAKYSTTFGDFGFDVHAGAKYVFDAETFDYKYGVALSNKTIIQNTTLKIAYDAGNDVDNKGTAEVSATIAF